MPRAKAAPLPAVTRAAIRTIEAGGEDVCPAAHGGCGGEVKFLARIPSRFRRQVIANVYWASKWNRTEHWHLLCYVRTGMPYGVPAEFKDDELDMMLAVVAHQPWSTPTEVLFDRLIAQYRDRQGNLNIAASN